jgi:hypothetical protein
MDRWKEMQWMTIQINGNSSLDPLGQVLALKYFVVTCFHHFYLQDKEYQPCFLRSMSSALSLRP